MGAVGALKSRAEFLPELREDLQRRRDSVCEGLERIDGVRFERPQGGIYVFADVREALKRLNYPSTRGMAEQILQTHRVAVLPGEAFGAPGWLRLSFGGTKSANSEAVDRLRAAFTERARG
jgi:aspartate aminotransferase